MDELILNGVLKRGSSGPPVRLIQEWLCLHGIGVVIDQDFGKATLAAVKKFQIMNSLEADGVVGPLTYAKLIELMANAMKRIIV